MTTFCNPLLSLFTTIDSSTSGCLPQNSGSFVGVIFAGVGGVPLNKNVPSKSPHSCARALTTTQLRSVASNNILFIAFSPLSICLLCASASPRLGVNKYGIYPGVSLIRRWLAPLLLVLAPVARDLQIACSAAHTRQNSSANQSTRRSAARSCRDKAPAAASMSSDLLPHT